MGIRSSLILILLLCLTLGSVPARSQPGPLPTIPREMRGIWIATTTNIDWPTRTDPVATQQSKLRAILDKAVELRCNVIVLQVRPACDAFYQSSIEPWSEFLTGQQGRAPSPLWDPLQYAIEQSHQRGLELHAWFNPYRAGYQSTSFFHSSHIINERPDLVREYSSYYWLDPGDPEVPQYSLSVIMDVVNRYDIDGVHIDDYFYPYSDGTPFPDSTTYAQYGNGLTLANWRRKNVDDFVQLIYTSIKGAKPHVKFGISPFGIWRPGNPSGIVGLDAYSSLYADSRKWLNNGWCDYFTPQLYWPIDQTGQEYPKLLDWWISQNLQGRLIVPGLFTGRVAFGGTPYWPASEIANQVALTQQRSGSVGNVHFSARGFMTNNGAGGDNINSVLKNGVYASKVLIPRTPWLDSVAPSAPLVTFTRESGDRWRLNWQDNGAEQARWWVLYYYQNNTWLWDILPASTTTNLLPGSGDTAPTWAVVSSVDRLGNESARVLVRLNTDPDAWIIE